MLAVCIPPKRYDEAQILKALKEFTDRWIIAEIDAKLWFSDGRIILGCEGPADEQHVFATKRISPEQWKKGMAKLLEAVPENYVRGVAGDLRGEFGFGYVREVRSAAAEISVWLQERYLRAIGPGCELWMHPSTEIKQPIYFVRDGSIAAVLMGMRNGLKIFVSALDGLEKETTVTDLAELPEIPFLEDAVLYHLCPDEEDW